MGHLIVCPLDIFTSSFLGWRDVTQLDRSWFNLLSPNLYSGLGGLITAIIVLFTQAGNKELGACLNNSCYVCCNVPNWCVGSYDGCKRPRKSVREPRMGMECRRWLWRAFGGCGGPEMSVKSLGLVWRALGGCGGPGMGVKGLRWV